MFVNLPNYQKIKSYLLLRNGNFNDNYLLYITCFNLGKHFKLMERRIVNNFLNNTYIDETFTLIEEIGGRTDKILRFGTLLEAFQNVDPAQYKDQIISTFKLQSFTVGFNKKRKFRKEYDVYKMLQEKYVHIDQELKFANPISDLFYRAIVFAHVNWTIFKLYESQQLLPLLSPSQITDLSTELKSSIGDFHL